MKWPYDESEQLGKLSEVELDEILARYFAGPREGRAPYLPLGCGQQDAYRDGAHPISEFIEEQTEPPPPGRHVPRWEWIRNRWVGIGASLFWSLAVIAGIAAAAVSWPAH